MDHRRILNTAAAVTAFALFAVSIARADEVLSFHLVTHSTSVQSLEVVDGHTLGLARQSRLALFPDGSVGTAYYAATNDWIKGAGTYLAYYNLTLSDGSVLWFKVTGLAKPEETTTFFRRPR